MTNCTKEPENDVVKTHNDAIDLIKRQDAIDALRTCYDTEAITYTNGNEYIDYDQALDLINALPSAQPKTGKWILSDNQSREDMENGNYYYICSNCLHGDVHAKTQEVPYCWYCGSYNGGK